MICRFGSRPVEWLSLPGLRSKAHPFAARAVCRQRLTLGSFHNHGSAFGSSRPRKWSNRQLLENHPRIRVGGLRGHSEVTLAYGGKTQIVQIEKEWTFG